MPARLGTSCTASFNSACCSPVSAGGNLLTDQMTVPGDHPPQTSWSIDLWCGHPGPTPELPPSPSIPGPAAISRATSPFPVASAPDTYAVVPQPHPSATVPAASPSPSCPTATPTPISSPNNSSTANSTQRQCGFHRGFGLAADALRIAISLNHPVYDCVYLALAYQVDGALVTADTRFFNIVAATEHASRVALLANFTPQES